MNDGPSSLHWLGVDALGRDIFSRILLGVRILLAAGILSVVVVYDHRYIPGAGSRFPMKGTGIG
ncbi:MAG: hypothetical protein ACR5LF_05490 [Symbiopectobacterium sp.]